MVSKDTGLSKLEFCHAKYMYYKHKLVLMLHEKQEKTNSSQRH